MKVNSKCYLCGCKDFKKREGSVRDNNALEIYECNSCGLVFLSTFDHINEGFYEESGMHDASKPEITTWLNETDWDDERRYQYLKPLLLNRSLLDFGCGAGGFLIKSQKLVTAAHGVEPEARLKKHFNKNGLTVFNNLTEISKDVQKKYDIITLFHVLEHIPDPKSILIQLSVLLDNGGQIIVEVPNANDALLTFYKNDPFSRFTYWSCHLFLFTTETLKTLVFQAGLKLNYIKQIQRYPISNHLYWLSNGKPGGHIKWHFLDSQLINEEYEKQLSSIGCCDTIISSISKHELNHP